MTSVCNQSNEVNSALHSSWVAKSSTGFKAGISPLLGGPVTRHSGTLPAADPRIDGRG